MDTSTMSVLEMVTDKVKITVAIKQQVMYELSFGVITFDLGRF